MAKRLAIIILTCFLTEVFAGDPKYNASTIPEELKTGMYAVIREQDSKFFINSRNSSTIQFRLVVTLLNSHAKRYATITLGYNKLLKIETLKAIVYDAEGNEIRKLKQNEIIDQSSISDYSLYEDSRIKHADLSQSIYPYTVVFEYTLSMKYLYSIPEFELYEDDEVSIQKSAYSIIYPKELKPRYKLNKIDNPKIAIEPDKRESLTWTFENIKPSKYETLSPGLDKVVPNIIAAPVDFEYDGYIGKMDSWKNLGKWQIQLNQGRDLLPELTRQKVKELIAGKTSREEKIKVLYEYLQNKTRYVSIQRGIGGFQPFDAKSVDQLGYGDCKALSNYMVAILKESGIKAYYTQIYAGKEDRPVPEDFTIDYFNHIVVAVPNEADTIWLECTSQTTPFGFLGSSTCDRYALMITDDGGELVRTPAYTAKQNTQSRIAEVFIERNGDAKAKISTTYSGLQYEHDGLGFYLTSPADDQKKWVQKNTVIPSFDISTFDMINKKGRIPSAIVNVDLTLKRFATVSGKRIFLTPNLMNRSTYIPEKVESRKTNVVRRMTYTDVDTIRYHLPEGIYPEYLPPPVKLKSRFGEYDASFTLDQENLIYIRKIKMNKGEFPPESYSELIEFYRNLNKADNTKMVFLSKT